MIQVFTGGNGLDIRLPSHVRLSSCNSKPLIQKHSKEPLVLEHKWEHGLSKHSSLSVAFLEEIQKKIGYFVYNIIGLYKSHN